MTSLEVLGRKIFVIIPRIIFTKNLYTEKVDLIILHRKIYFSKQLLVEKQEYIVFTATLERQKYIGIL